MVYCLFGFLLCTYSFKNTSVILVLETQFSGDDILLIFPDKNSPALLSSMIAGVPFNKAHVLDFAPGEGKLSEEYLMTTVTAPMLLPLNPNPKP